MIGIYSNNLERFLIVKDDLWMSLQTAKLLSSKLCLTVCKISDHKKINNNNCLTWSLDDTNLAISDRPVPRLVFIEDKIIDLKKHSPDIKKEKIIQYKKFSNFVFNCVKASRLTNALLNNIDQKYFLDLLDVSSIDTEPDNFGTKKSFLSQVDQILYMANDENEIKEKLKLMFSQDSKFPSTVQLYIKNFYKYLSYYETNL